MTLGPRVATLTGVLAALLATPALSAQHRPHATHRPAPASPPVATVVRAVRTSLRDARVELPRHFEALTVCLRDAAARDPVRLSRHSALMVVVNLTPASRAETVEVTTERLPAGLSLCLASALQGWRQRPWSQPRARVEIRVAPLAR